MTSPIPKVSIGLPVYNGERFLAATVDSLLAQTFVNFELVISDNASTDGTVEICQEYAARDSRIRYYREGENRGAPWNLSRVFHLSRGQYFKWQAADDLCAPSFLERCVDILEHDRAAVLAYPRTAIIDQHGDIVPDAQGSWNVDEAALRHFDSDRPADRVRTVLMHTVWCHELFGVVRRDLMAQTALHRDRSSGGKPFLLEMALKGRFIEVPEVLFFSRRHETQYSMLTSAAAQRQFDQPGKRRPWISLPHQVGCTLDYAANIARAPISWRDRAACFGVLVRYVAQAGKWKRILRGSIRGFGMWDGTLAAAPTGPRRVTLPEKQTSPEQPAFAAASAVESNQESSAFC